MYEMILSFITAFCPTFVIFLKYHISPVKLFMGDSGSLLLDVMDIISAIEFIELHKIITYPDLMLKVAYALTIASLILTLFNTHRFFSIRLYHVKSPSYTDRFHIHNLLIDNSLYHMTAILTLVELNIIFIAMAFFLEDKGNFLVLMAILGLALSMIFLLHQHARSNKALNL